MTSPERIRALIDAVRYIVNCGIPGDIVECGVWKGGSMMAVAMTLLSLKHATRDLFLFDTFEGMPKPNEIDVSPVDGKASDWFDDRRTGQNTSDWCYASLDDVKRAMERTGYENSKIHFVKGLVEETIPQNAPRSISLLRLDTDLYESTLHELSYLFPRLVHGGVIVIDDYACWLGCQKATHEYLAKNKITLLLHRIDASGARIGVKI